MNWSPERYCMIYILDNKYRIYIPTIWIFSNNIFVCLKNHPILSLKPKQYICPKDIWDTTTYYDLHKHTTFYNACQKNTPHDILVVFQTDFPPFLVCAPDQLMNHVSHINIFLYPQSMSLNSSFGFSLVNQRFCNGFGFISAFVDPLYLF